MSADSDTDRLAGLSEWNNLKEVARALDVHYMTAYRYVRRGRLAARWEGNGWLVHRDDVMAIVCPSDRGGTPSALPTQSVDWPRRLADRLVAGDETGAWTVIEAALSAGWSARDCFTDLIAASLVLLGNRWRHATTADLVDERLATATAMRCAHRLGTRFTRPGRRKGVVVLGTPPGEHHLLPVSIAAELVRLRNYTVLELGADCPTATFVAAAVRAERLRAVGIGVTRAEHLDAALEIRDRLSARLPGTPVLLGGQAVANPEVAALVGSSLWAPDGADLAERLDELLGEHRRVHEHAIG
ncbi:MAG: helix-turn-helix domain-containing protein [Microthrixaceae bacterium]